MVVVSSNWSIAVVCVISCLVLVVVHRGMWLVVVVSVGGCVWRLHVVTSGCAGG